MRRSVPLAAAFGLALGVEVFGSSHFRGADALNLALVAGVAAPLARLESRPIAATACSLAAVVAMDALATPVEPLVTPVALMFVLPFAIAVRSDLRPALAGLLVAAAGVIGGELASPDSVRDPGSLLPTAAVVAAAWGVGRVVRARDAGLLDLRRGEERLREEQAAARRLAVTQERERIARELHDVIAHSMTAVVLQAGAAQRIWDTDRERALAALGAVGSVAREALVHIRRTLPELGTEAGGAIAQLGDLGALADRARASGLRVTLRAERIDRPLPATVELVAYRTVQEALTNAARHAHGSEVDVHTRCGSGELLVEVTDSGGSSTAIGGAGMGLAGMRERVGACGGELEAGPRPGGGFGVSARLPL